ncbi:hypothetical protein [Bacteroides reticulotermitis]|uniref:hypothetical protein n=1 Tax=Bacteroides reticulotermitis TaxID=1133319 RepID=UPI003A83F526
MKLLRTIANVMKYCATEEYIILSDDYTYIYDINLDLLKEIKKRCSILIQFNKTILFQEQNGESIFKIEKSTLKEKIGKYFLSQYFIVGDNLFVLNENDSIIEFDSNLNELKKYTIGRFPKFLFFNKFIRTPNGKIICYDLYSNSILWEYNFSDLLNGIEIKQIGEFIFNDDKIYFYLYDDRGSYRSTICIDVNTGEILHKYGNFGGDLYLFEKKIGVAAYNTIQILDTLTNQVEEYDFSEILAEHKLEIRWNGNIFTEEGLLYFIGTGGAKNKVGLLNLKTQELLWHASFDIPETEYNINQQVSNIKLQENKFYVHCSDNTLHIFENE